MTNFFSEIGHDMLNALQVQNTKHIWNRHYAN